jgi:hypothetical protein
MYGRGRSHQPSPSPSSRCPCNRKEIGILPYEGHRDSERLVSPVEGLPMPEAASRLGISVAAAKSRLVRGRLELRSRLSCHVGSTDITCAQVSGFCRPERLVLTLTSNYPEVQNRRWPNAKSWVSTLLTCCGCGDLLSGDFQERRGPPLLITSRSSSIRSLRTTSQFARTLLVRKGRALGSLGLL